MNGVSRSFSNFEPWNKGKLVGQKLPLKLKEVWTIRIRLQVANRFRDLALFNLAIDSKLRDCDLVSLNVRDICHGGQVLKRAKIVQQKTHQPVQFEITTQTGDSLSDWMMVHCLTHNSWLFPSRINAQRHISTRQYNRTVHQWIEAISLDSSLYGTHSLSRTKVAMIYRKTGNLRAVQLLLGHTKLESTVRYLGIEVDDALDLSEQTEV